MKLVGISCVRDEADIIESFVRHNLNYLDKLIVVDNLSKDGTLDILVNLRNEGLNLDIRTFPSNQHDQEIAISNVLNSFPLGEEGFTFAILLDADEFIAAESKSIFIDLISCCDPNSYPIMAWKTYIPDVTYKLPHGKCITHSMRLRRDPEGSVFYKAIVPAIFFGNCIVGKGNHLIGSTTIPPQKPQVIPCKLAHFPIRSPEQALCKLILGSHTLSRKPGRSISEGIHWDHLANRLRELNYHMSSEILIEFALNYAQPEDSVGMHNLVYDPMILFEDTELKYSSQASVSVIQRFDRYIASLHIKT